MPYDPPLPLGMPSIAPHRHPPLLSIFFLVNTPRPPSLSVATMAARLPGFEFSRRHHHDAVASSAILSMADVLANHLPGLDSSIWLTRPSLSPAYRPIKTQELNLPLYPLSLVHLNPPLCPSSLIHALPCLDRCTRQLRCPSFEMARLVICGSPGCDAQLPSPPKACQACRSRCYCDQACQKADWPTHRLYCFSRDCLNDHDKTCYAFDKKHQNLLLTIARSLFQFDKRFVHLCGEERLRFLAVAHTSFLHVKLRLVKNAPPGRWNRVQFVSAELEDISLLAKRNRLLAFERLELRFPCIAFGYSIVKADGSFTSISTTTHPFRWPSPDDGRPLPPKKAIALIQLFQRMWTLEAQEEEVKRWVDGLDESHETTTMAWSKVGGTSACGRGEGRKVSTAAGEAVEVGWSLAFEGEEAAAASQV